MSTSPQVGAVFAGYALDAVVGRGGMAVVYSARDLRLDRRVAVKVLSADLAADAQFRDRFIRESQLAASIDHPHIVPVYEAGEADGVLFIAMRYVEGSDLHAVIRSEGALDPGRTIALVEQVASALDAAHDHGLIHRDVKPANVLIVPGQGPSGGEHAYLADFGLTKRSSATSGLTMSGVFLGTADYVAPEQITGTDIDRRVDVYSLGCLVYECLTGRPPFERDSDIAVMFAHVQEPPPLLNATRPDLGLALGDVLGRAMAKSRDARYPSCGALAAAARLALSDYVPHLTIRDGLLAGRTIHLDSDVVLGRDDTRCALLDPAVSRRHAIVQRTGRDLHVIDLGSRNGTWVNGRRITAVTPLHTGDVIVVGGTSIEVGGDRRGGVMGTVILSLPGSAATGPAPIAPLRGTTPLPVQAPAQPPAAFVAGSAAPGPAAAPPGPPAAVPQWAPGVLPSPSSSPPPAGWSGAPHPAPAAPPGIGPALGAPPTAVPRAALPVALLRSLRRIPALASGPRSKWVVVAVWLAIAATFLPLASKLSTVTDDRIISFLPASAESVQVNELIKNRFPGGINGTAIVVYQRTGGLTDADRAVIQNDLARISAVDGVRSAVPPVGSGAGPGQVSQDGAVAFTIVPLASRDQDLTAAVTALRDRVGTGSGGLTVHVTGAAAIESDLFTALQSADGKLLVVTGLLVVLLLLLIYRSPVVALVPLLVVGVSYVIAAGIGYLIAVAGLQVTSTSTSLLLVLMFGAGTDYCLLVVSRHSDFLQRIQDRHEAVSCAVTRVAPAVIASGFTVISALLVLLVAQLASTRTLGPVNAIGIAVMLLSSLTLLPALLAIVGRRGFWPKASKVRFDEDAAAEPMPGGIWRRVGDGVVRRPIVSLVVVVAVLGAGALGLGAYNEKASNLDAFRSQTDGTLGYAALKTGFPEGTLAPLTVIVQQDGRPISPDSVAAVRDRLSSEPDVAAASVLGASADGSAAAFNVVLKVDPYSNQAFDRLETMRHDVGNLGNGLHVLFGGTTAVQEDYKTAAHRDLHVLVPLVLLVIFATLAILLRALVAPLFLIASVILSFFGILGICLVFFRTVLGQDGFDPNLLMFSFIFLVALGVDYNIFLMERVRYEAERHGTRHGALLALVATGPVITSAGLILSGTFAALTTLPITILVELGTIVGFGVLLDTLLVRSVLVPAVTVLLGDRVWWPARLHGASADAPHVVVPVPAQLALPGSRSGMAAMAQTNIFAPAPTAGGPAWTLGSTWTAAAELPATATAPAPPIAAPASGVGGGRAAGATTVFRPAPAPTGPGSTRAHNTADVASGSPRLRLQVVEGSDAGSTVALAASVDIGRDATAQLVLTDDLVSWRHARIGPFEGGAVIADLGSQNGTFVGERRIVDPTRLGPGDSIRIGATVLRVVAE